MSYPAAKLVVMQSEIRGPYDMAHQSRFFGGWTRTADGAVVMAFPVEGWTHSAAVTLRQTGGDTVSGQVIGGDETAWTQALSVLSLDVDGTGYAEIGDRDPVIGKLQREHAFLRPVLFHSPYEAACAFVIGHRIRIEQGRAIRAQMAREHGEAFDIPGTIAGPTVHAFPPPQVLRGITEIPGVNDEKITRLHGIADAALDGGLDRARLRAMPVADALADVRKLRGIGEFFAVGIVMRGAGLIDAVPNDDITRAGIQRFYGSTDVDRITPAWKPFRTWCSVLVHAAEREARAGA
jgi:DNA-3-methyladenine glycosylase II